MTHDQTYCASPGCRNKCGRRPPVHAPTNQWQSWAYFCGPDTNGRTFRARGDWQGFTRDEAASIYASLIDRLGPTAPEWKAINGAALWGHTHAWLREVKRRAWKIRRGAAVRLDASGGDGGGAC